MDWKVLKRFIAQEHKRLIRYYGSYTDGEKRILARAVKLMEEVGELSEEILAHGALQRKDKMRKRKSGNLEEEFADVLITTLLLAAAIDVDIERALRSKMKKIEKRYEK